MSTHLHNGHTPSESDGNPLDYYSSEQPHPDLPHGYSDQHYPNVYAGSPSTAASATRGRRWAPCGSTTTALITRRRTSTGAWSGPISCTTIWTATTRPRSGGFHLPSGEYDVPLVFGDKVFDSKCRPPTTTCSTSTASSATSQTVNGKIQPFFNVKKRRYRLRLHNTGPSRFLSFTLSNNTAVLADLQRRQPAAQADQAHHASDGRRAGRYHRGLQPGHGIRVFLMNVRSTSTEPAQPARS